MSSTPSVSPSDVSDASRIQSVFAASIAAIVISGLFFAGRLISKRIQRQAINASDYVLFLSLCCCWGLSSVDIYMTTVGLGRHIDWVKAHDPSLSDVKQMLKVFIADEVFYDLGIASVKISILLLYKTLFAGDPSFALTANVIMGVVAAWFVGNLLPSIFSCRPIAGFWDLDPHAVCIDKTALYVCGSTINIITDLIILCLPLRKVRRLNFDRRRKYEVAAVFLLGGFVCIISIVRFTVLFDSNSPDVTWKFAEVLNWSVAEVAVAIASACLPLMRPLLRAITPKSWPSWLSSPSSSTIQDTRTVLPSSATPRVGYYRFALGGNSTGGSLEDQAFTTTIDSERGGDRKSQDAHGSMHDENGLANGIVMTKTFELTSVTYE